jgi:hypothetical protein
MPQMASDARKKNLKEAYMMLQELRVALFAVGEVRPQGKISEVKLAAKLDELPNALDMMFKPANLSVSWITMSDHEEPSGRATLRRQAWKSLSHRRSEM